MSTYAALVLANPALVAYIKQDEVAGVTAFDSGPYGYDGTYFRGPTLGQPPLADGTSVTYNGAAQHVAQFYDNTDPQPFQANGRMFAECWFKSVTVAQQVLLASDFQEANGRYFVIRIAATGQLTFVMFDDTAIGHVLTSAAVYTDGAPHYVGCGFDGTTMFMYVDSPTPETTVPAMGGAGLAFTNHGWTIGMLGNSGLGGSDWLTGTVDEAAIYEDILSPTDVGGRLDPPALHAIYGAGTF